MAATRKTGLKYLAAFFAAVLLMLGVNARLESMRADDDLEITDADLPPTLAVTTFALGPLRGLIADGLWWRVIRHQDQGNFFETMQLTRWITYLQPRFPSVWAYHGWNLSYNVAYEFADPAVRWEWIERGIGLLRDEGLKYNPQDEIIELELARIFLDRIGGTNDDASEFYMWKWAENMMPFLPEGTREEIQALAAADDFDSLQKNSQTVGLIVGAREGGVDLTTPRKVLAARAWAQQNRQLLQQVNHWDDWRELLASARAVLIREDLKLDPDRMLLIDREFGPFDWRMPQAQVVYWQVEEDSYEEYLENNPNPGHFVRQAMEQAFHSGRLVYNPATNTYMATNNLQIAARIHDYYDHALHSHPTELLHNLHRNFLRDAIAVLYSYNYKKAAKDLFEHFEEDYNAGGRSFDDFAVTELQRLLGGATTREARSLIDAMLYQAYLWLGTGNADKAQGYAQSAYSIWKRHQTKYARVNPERMLPDFETLKNGAYQRVLESEAAAGLKKEVERRQEDLKPQGDSEGRELDVGSLMHEDDD